MIYIVEDDGSIRELVTYTLNSQGLETEGFSVPSQFWKAMGRMKPDLVLLDIMLPEEDGLTILKKLRADKDTEHIPVIMLTAKDGEYDTVISLDSGADDYIAKPFRMMELISRIRAVMRRSKRREEQMEEYRVGDLYVNPSGHIVRAGEETVTLTLKEFEVLCLLIRHPGTVFTRAQLLDEIWGYEFDGESRTVDVHIRTLRQKLGPAGDCIETIRGVGYKIDSGK
ncbi:DNA-binding response regulator [Lachnoclostridium sp. An14]|uniref:response regulator transcription factor n=1 Tax=Lachnoclostridium sp. An14 TaxID=1965562 RepID=UPI000B369E34|nr:response regulator transcription factor [Lachnoclostridium sp. An14]OUQ17196.1 DNA-binding response regulator [Lachnoclostridium sp. An14]